MQEFNNSNFVFINAELEFDTQYSNIVNLRKRQGPQLTPGIAGLAIRTQRTITFWNGEYGLPFSRQQQLGITLNNTVFQTQNYTYDNFLITRSLLLNFVDRIIIDAYWNDEQKDWYVCPNLIPGISGENNTQAQANVQSYDNGLYTFNDGVICQEDLTLATMMRDINNWINTFHIKMIYTFIYNLHNLGITTPTILSNSTTNIFNFQESNGTNLSMSMQSKVSFFNRIFGNKDESLIISSTPESIAQMSDSRLLFTPMLLNDWRTDTVGSNKPINPYFSRENLISIGWPNSSEIVHNATHIILGYGNIDSDFLNDTLDTGKYNLALDNQFIFNASEIQGIPIIPVTSLNIIASSAFPDLLDERDKKLEKRQASSSTTSIGVSSTLVSCATPGSGYTMVGTGFDNSSSFSSTQSNSISWNYAFVITDEDNEFYGSQLLTSITRCGFSSLFSYNFDLNSLWPSVWSWQNGSPSEVVDGNNCAVFVASSGRWAPVSCTDEYPVICQRLNDHEYGNGTTMKANPFDFVIELGSFNFFSAISKCREGYSLGLPRTSQENSMLLNAMSQTDISVAWINLRQIEPTCWSVGTDLSCPYASVNITYKDIISATLKEDLVIVIVVGIFIFFRIRGMIRQSRLRRYHANVNRKLSKMDYKTVPK